MLGARQDYYFDGYYKGKFSSNPTLTKILDISNELLQDKVKDGFELISKYHNSDRTDVNPAYMRNLLSVLDLRPSVYQYDPCFLNVLFENDIPNLINDLVGSPLTLGHIQLRVANPVGGWSYMTWHRDLYRYEGKVIGPVPSSHKLILYPKLNQKEEDILGILPGSHLQQHWTEKEDQKYLLDNRNKEVLIQNSDSEFVFYNASMLHATKPNTIHQPRIIYSFCADNNLGDFPENKELHETYKDRVRRNG